VSRKIITAPNSASIRCVREKDLKKQHDDTRQKSLRNHQQDVDTRRDADSIKGSQDSAWKEVIKKYFLLFLQFYFPRMALEIDFHQPLIFLDKEFKKLFAQSTSRNRYADLLVQASARTGTPPLLYIHIEVQGKKEQNFTKRLFTYAYRIFDRVGEFPASLILLTDSDRKSLCLRSSRKRKVFTGRISAGEADIL